MYTKWVYSLLSFYFLTLSFDTYSLDIYEALSLVKKHSLDLQKIEQERVSINHNVAKLDGRFDFSFDQQVSYEFDKSKSQSSIRNKSNTIYSSTTLSKENSWGTQFKTTFDLDYSDVTESKGGASLLQRSINPAFDTKIQLEISQPLYRNWLGKEHKLEKEVAKAEGVPVKHSLQLIKQELQNKIELLFLQHSYLLEQKRVIQEILKYRKKHLDLIVNRKIMGRSEDLDEARERFNLLQDESRVLDLDLKVQEIEKVLFYEVYAYTSNEDQFIKQHPLNQEVSPLPASDLARAVDYALSSRIDMKRIRESKEYQLKKIEWVEEKNKMNLNAFIVYQVNGIDKKISKSLRYSINSDYPKFEVGIKLSFPLGDRSHKNEKLSEIARLSSLSIENKQLENQVRHELDINFFALQSADKRIQQNEKIYQALLVQKEKEFIKYHQARSESVLLLMHEINLLEVALNRIHSLFDKRKAEASIRFLCHAY